MALPLPKDGKPSLDASVPPDRADVSRVQLTFRDHQSYRALGPSLESSRKDGRLDKLQERDQVAS
jgi:hypothetical protein